MLRKIQKYVATKGKVSAKDISIALDMQISAVEMGVDYFVQKNLIDKVDDCSSRDNCSSVCASCSMSTDSTASYIWVGERVITMK